MRAQRREERIAALGSGWGQRLGENLDIEVAGATHDVDGAEGERLTGQDERGALEDGLADDGVLGSVGGLRRGDAGLFDPGAKAKTIGEAVESGVEVDADVEIGDLGFLGGFSGVEAAGGDRNLVALLESVALADDDHEKVLGADALAVVGLIKGEGEPVSGFGDVELGDETGGESELVGSVAAHIMKPA